MGIRPAIVLRAAVAIAMCLASAVAISGCLRIRGTSCSVDVDCDQGRVCREAMCRKPCMASHWVGERVEVTAGKLVKQAEISACEQRRYWVRYESGVEEQVDETRFPRRARK
ncbi:MAG: hypothetical protein HY898_20005 [Deltaproteobacteria bacterium]|nr:hypothetical protein [Deltaproteobacteria bacterium]